MSSLTAQRTLTKTEPAAMMKAEMVNMVSPLAAGVPKRFTQGKTSGGRQNASAMKTQVSRFKTKPQPPASLILRAIGSICRRVFGELFFKPGNAWKGRADGVKERHVEWLTRRAQLEQLEEFRLVA